jgi:hypothetical protein
MEKIILCLLIGLFNISRAQQPREKEVEFLIKTSLFAEAGGTKNYVANQAAFENFLKLDFRIDTIEQVGFEDFVFLSVDPVYKNPQNVSLEEGPILLDNCDRFVVGIHRKGRTIYKLKGFRNSDFPNFISALKNLNYPNVSSYKKFKSHYSVQGLDLGCLYKAFKNYSSDKGKYPCLKNCSDAYFSH